MNQDTLEKIARTVHSALSAWRVANAHEPYDDWDSMTEADKASTYESVEYVVDNPDADASAQHDQWMAQKLADGWKYGRKRNNSRKRHPMLVPYDELPDYEQRKDALLNAIVTALHAETE